MIKIKWIFLICIFLITSCYKRKEEVLSNKKSADNRDSIVHLKKEWYHTNDTIFLSHITENIKYLSLEIPVTTNIFQLEYTDSIIIASIKNGIYWFNQNGKRLNGIPLQFACFCLSERKDSIYTYEPLNKTISCYDFNGNQIWSSRLHHKEKEVGYYGHFFSLVNDTAFAIAFHNQGFNSDQLIFVNKQGKVIKNITNSETFTYSGHTYTSQMSWQRILTRNQKQLFYHSLYGDTIFNINEQMQLTPIIVENIIKKVPLISRPEYTGKTWKEFGLECLEKQINVTRIFNSSRYIILEAKLADITSRMSNYWIYDKKDKSLKRTFNDLEDVYIKKCAHFGIYNNYDGGLAFAPDFISNEHLIMANASELQGKKSIYAKQLYKNNYNLQNQKIIYSSNTYSDLILKEKADAFWNNCNEKELTLTIIKLKSK